MKPLVNTQICKLRSFNISTAQCGIIRIAVAKNVTARVRLFRSCQAIQQHSHRHAQIAKVWDLFRHLHTNKTFVSHRHRIPTPPAGYIQKQTDIVKLQDERVDAHLYKALGSISLEYLMQVPLSQSGVAKAYDRDGANNFVYGVAEDLVRVMDRVYKLINLWRYNEIITSENDLFAQVPVITVPEKYDLFNSQIILTLIREAKAAGVSTLVLNEMMREYTNKYFNANPDVAKMLGAMLELDPLVGYTIDEKISMVTTGLVKKEDGIISSYIQMFIQKAVSEDESFLDKSSMEKRAILEKMAAVKLKEMSTVAELMKVAPPAPPTPPAV